MNSWPMPPSPGDPSEDNHADLHENLWNRPAFEMLKREMLVQLIQRGTKKKVDPSLKDLSVTALLKALWKKMHAEEPVQPRTSFS